MSSLQLKHQDFSIEIDVDEWISIEQTEKADMWHFEFQSVQEGLDNVREDEIGTQIIISDLYDSVKNSFDLENFITRLKKEITFALYDEYG